MILITASAAILIAALLGRYAIALTLFVVGASGMFVEAGLYSVANRASHNRRRGSLTTVVWRDGAPVSILAAEVVVGDVLELSPGSTIPADARLLGTSEVLCQPAAIRGKEGTYLLVRRAAVLPPSTAAAERINMVLTGERIEKGRGNAVVVRL